MLGRFTVRPDETAPGRFAVWDSAVSGLRATDLAQDQAYEMATELDIQYDAHGPRSTNAIRKVDPQQQVDRVERQPAGVLDVWIRDAGEWLGRVRTPDGHVSWIQADHLLPRRRN